MLPCTVFLNKFSKTLKKLIQSIHQTLYTPIGQLCGLGLTLLMCPHPIATLFQPVLEDQLPLEVAEDPLEVALEEAADKLIK